LKWINYKLTFFLLFMHPRAIP